MILQKPFSRALSFFEEARREGKKVNWPTSRETVTNTILVIVFTIVVAILLGLFDYLFGQILEILIL